MLCSGTVTVLNVKFSIMLGLLNSHNTKYNIQKIMRIKTLSSWDQMSPGEQSCLGAEPLLTKLLAGHPTSPLRSILLTVMLYGLCGGLGPHPSFYKPPMSHCLSFPHRQDTPIKQFFFSSPSFPFSWGRPLFSM